jgi:(1->4)-alpha-D-glucan 1-alpha-D-glucosylmutase
VVEKILGSRETLRDDWPVEGTSGYDFLNLVNGLFVDGRNRRGLTRVYQDWTQDLRSFADVVYDSKRLIMQVSLASELHMLAYQLDRLAQQHRRSRDFTFNSLRHALEEVIACFPVYRSYVTSEGYHPDDRRYVQQAVSRAERKNPAVSREIFEFLRAMLLLEYPPSASDEEQDEQCRLVGKFQQVTAPVMAKGLEDTAFYVHNRLASLNEVGNDADRFGVTPEEVHRSNQERQHRWPLALSPLSTHDTKRSEDVRARLNVLSELPEEWQAGLKRWSDLNAPHRRSVEDEPVPSANEEYLLYQTLVGAWPLEPYTDEAYADFVERVQAYMGKALHEAKVHTSWINPHLAYDAAVQEYIASILDPEANSAFLDDFRDFARRISYYGMLNSLSQTLVKIASPGVPDTYQGTELWDFSLVDPDNRRAVDYARRQQLLQDLQAGLEGGGEKRLPLVRELLRHLEDGRVKLYVTALALHQRRSHPGLFSRGEYVPIQVTGAKREHLFGFSRRHAGHEAIVVVPRLIGRLLPDGFTMPLGEGIWQDTRLLIEGIDRQRGWRDAFTGELATFSLDEGRPSLRAAELMGHFPVALLVTSE